MNTNILSRFLVASIAALCISVTMAQETSKTTSKTSTTKTSQASTKTSKSSTEKADSTKTVDPSTIPDDTFFLTNGSWEKGISLRWAGFFVKNTPDNIEQYVAGNTVVFPNGDKRTITAAASSAPYLNIRVSGDKLKSADVGLPSKFKVVVNADKKSVLNKVSAEQKPVDATKKPTEQKPADATKVDTEKKSVETTEPTKEKKYFWQ
jgi:hypothetical protein